MSNKQTAMTQLIEKILRMPESNIKGFLKIASPAYIEAEKEQIIDAAHHGVDYENSPYKDAEEYYNETYNKKDDA